MQRSPDARTEAFPDARTEGPLVGGLDRIEPTEVGHADHAVRGGADGHDPAISCVKWPQRWVVSRESTAGPSRTS